MGAQPRVNALGVETVAARWQDAHHVAVGEFGEAYGAVDQIDGARCFRVGVGGCGGGGRGEGESRKSADGLLLQSLGGRRDGRGEGGAATPGAASGEGEGDEADEGAEEDGEDDDDVGVEGEEVLLLRRRERVGRLADHR